MTDSGRTDGGAENAGVENAGVENARVSQGWKMQERQSMESHQKKYSKVPDEIWLSWLSCL